MVITMLISMGINTHWLNRIEFGFGEFIKFTEFIHWFTNSLWVCKPPLTCTTSLQRPCRRRLLVRWWQSGDNAHQLWSYELIIIGFLIREKLSNGEWTQKLFYFIQKLKLVDFKAISNGIWKHLSEKKLSNLNTLTSSKTMWIAASFKKF